MRTPGGERTTHLMKAMYLGPRETIYRCNYGRIMSEPSMPRTTDAHGGGAPLAARIAREALAER